MLIRHNPKAMPQPVSVYSQGVEVPSGARWLYVSGQVGALPDGRMAEGFEAQAEGMAVRARRRGRARVSPCRPN
jgi:enamine deaminase RidA (YjgF/YER057c/UK114 family)